MVPGAWRRASAMGCRYFQGDASSAQLAGSGMRGSATTSPLPRRPGSRAERTAAPEGHSWSPSEPIPPRLSWCAQPNMEVFHVGLKWDGSRSDWKWLDGTTLEWRFPNQCSARSFLPCGRLSGSGLLGGLCGDGLGWVCEQRAATLRWLASSSPAFLWGNTTYTCVAP
ncbi:killer cell lectin-like receptor subfamily G member 1 [Columba livia]|uniref:Killer cell lectin-like receptor subfamily G member 1 n=1 Tax=Columba livia TaxID=8932 RepID=A0A2I0LHS9_COLLI|nr:killer cell lectin-like receptor subfamily G member 1 [Columba livia]